MAGGDMRVKFTDPNLATGFAKNAQAETIDASSTKRGNMTEERSLDGKSFYLTEAGAKAFDELQKSGWDMKALKDPGMLSSLIGTGGESLGAKGEQHQGDV